MSANPQVQEQVIKAIFAREEQVRGGEAEWSGVEGGHLSAAQVQSLPTHRLARRHPCQPSLPYQFHPRV